MCLDCLDKYYEIITNEAEKTKEVLLIAREKDCKCGCVEKASKKLKVCMYYELLCITKQKQLLSANADFFELWRVADEIGNIIKNELNDLIDMEKEEFKNEQEYMDRCERVKSMYELVEDILMCG